MFHQGESARNEAIIDLINRNWESIAQLAFEGYVYGGLGALTMNEKGILSGNLDFGFQQDGWPNSEIERQVAEYDPQTEVVILIRRLSGKQECFRISTPTGHLPPPAATKESYRACEHSFRDAHGPFDVFQPLLDDPNREQDQNPVNELPADLKAALRDFLRALRVNRAAFHGAGLDLDELCPYAIYGDVCADRIILLSALRDGIVRIDDSEGKRLWKPGPNWRNLLNGQARQQQIKNR